MEEFSVLVAAEKGSEVVEILKKDRHGVFDSRYAITKHDVKGFVCSCLGYRYKGDCKHLKLHKLLTQEPNIMPQNVAQEIANDFKWKLKKLYPEMKIYANEMVDHYPVAGDIKAFKIMIKASEPCIIVGQKDGLRIIVFLTKSYNYAAQEKYNQCMVGL